MLSTTVPLWWNLRADVVEWFLQPPDVGDNVGLTMQEEGAAADSLPPQRPKAVVGEMTGVAVSSVGEVSSSSAAGAVV